MTYHYLDKTIPRITRAKALIQSTAAKVANLYQIISTHLLKTSWLKTTETNKTSKVYRSKKENKYLKGYKSSSRQVNRSLLLTLQASINKSKDR